ncbi:MAG TPA: M20 family metallopeptidase [Acidimicrobiia bacterium]|nr:M20 family metallopeptidase [Acidimicrobiia bacterium]
MGNSAEIDRAKARACEVVDRIADELIGASHAIHGCPELGYAEHFAVDRLAGLLERHGLPVERAAYGIETAFAARAGTDGGPHVVVCCEYDALPGIGHGCGHNIIGAAGVGAGIALSTLADELGGRVTTLGTPAEELSGGGKIRLLDAGAFADADVAMMVHPEAGDVEYVPYLANDVLIVEMHGKAAHASSSPWAGINALDAIVAGYTAVAALRQHIRDDEKVHGIILEGGTADNVVPEYASARFRVRARSVERLAPLKDRVLACFEGAARQTGARLEHRWLGGYLDMQSNRAVAAAYRANGERLGRRFHDPRRIPASIAGSTDMGNVSYALPAIHPVIGMCPLDIAGHTTEFAEWAVSESGDLAVLDGAKALAMTAIDVWLRPELRSAAREEFARLGS